MRTASAVSDILTDFSFDAGHLDIEAVHAAFGRHGIVVITNGVQRDQCKLLQAEMGRHYAEHDVSLESYRAAGSNRFACETLVWDPLGERNAAFLELLDNELLVKATTACLNPGWRPSNGLLVMRSLTGGEGQAWHQDCLPSADLHQFNLNRLLYVSDVSKEDGAVVVMPGSHQGGRIPMGSAQEDLTGQIALTPTAGTLVLLHGWTWHRVTPNHSRRDRSSINCRAFPAGCASDEPTRFGVYRNATVDFATGAVLPPAQLSTSSPEPLLPS